MENFSKVESDNFVYKSKIDLTGFVILMGLVDIILHCIGLSEPYRILVTFIILVIRLLWWGKNRSASVNTLTLLGFTKLLIRKLLVCLADTKGTFL